MKILSFDSSSEAAGVAISEDGALIAEYTLSAGRTHSETLMLMADSLLACSKVSPGDIDVFAAAAGPGSFTGLRIAAAAANGMSFALKKPCAAVSTLEAMALCVPPRLIGGGIICPVMDARNSMVYAAIFKTEGGALKRLGEDQAVPVGELCGRLLREFGGAVIFTGDASAVCVKVMNEIRGTSDSDLSANGLSWDCALPWDCALSWDSGLSCVRGVAAAAFKAALDGNLSEPGLLKPKYLRLPQAEREYIAKQLEKTDKTAD